MDPTYRRCCPHEAPTDDQDEHHPDGYVQRYRDREPRDDEVTGGLKPIEDGSDGERGH